MKIISDILGYILLLVAFYLVYERQYELASFIVLVLIYTKE